MGEHTRIIEIEVFPYYHFSLLSQSILPLLSRFDVGVHETVLHLLEYFEIIYPMRTGNKYGNSDKISREQMFFIPSLLSLFSAKATHPSLTYWQQADEKYVSVVPLTTISKHYTGTLTYVDSHGDSFQLGFSPYFYCDLST